MPIGPQGPQPPHQPGFNPEDFEKIFGSQTGSQSQQVLLAGLMNVLQAITQLAEQLEQTIQQSSDELSSMAETGTAETGASTPSALTQPQAPNLVRFPSIPADDPKSQHLVATSGVVVNLAKIAKELEIIMMSSKQLASLNYNQDPSKVLREVKNQFQNIFKAAQGLNGAQQGFDELARDYPDFQELRGSINENINNFLSSNGPLAQLTKLREQLELIAQARQTALGQVFGQGQFIKMIQAEAVRFHELLKSSTGPITKAKSDLAKGMNKLGVLATLLDEEKPRELEENKLGATAPRGEASHHAEAKPGLGAGQPGVGAAPPQTHPDHQHSNIWWLAEYILLGKVLPGIDNNIYLWNEALVLENMLLSVCGPMVERMMDKMPNWKLGTSNTQIRAELNKMFHSHYTFTSKGGHVWETKGEFTSWLKAMYSDLSKMYAAENQMKGKVPSSVSAALRKEVSGLKYQLKAIEGIAADVAKLSFTIKTTKVLKNGVIVTEKVTVLKSGQGGIISKWNQDMQNFQGAVKTVGVDIQNQSTQTSSELHLQQTYASQFYQFFTQFVQTMNDILNAISQNTKGGQ